jgi:hypothetical protein
MVGMSSAMLNTETCILFMQYICAFHMTLTVDSCYFPTQ